MLKLAPEGTPYIAVFFALAIAAVFALGPRWALVPLALMLFMVYFFRDPDRAAPPEPGFLSPADGKVMAVIREREDEHLKDDVLRISIFMSPLDVHVNRSPCAGRVESVTHTPGSVRAAFRQDAHLTNENTALILDCRDEGPILVRQIAGFLARRTVCRAAPGDTLERGQRFGMIKFSSRLDVFLPAGAEPRVAPGDRARAGQTILAVLPEAP